MYENSLSELRNNGVVTGQESPEKLAALVQVGSKYGATGTKKWIADTDIDSVFKSDADKLARGAQYSVELSSKKINTGIQGYSTAINSSTNTANRSALDRAVKQTINNDKVPSPTYSGDSLFRTDNEDVFTNQQPTFRSDNEDVFTNQEPTFRSDTPSTSGASNVSGTRVSAGVSPGVKNPTGRVFSNRKLAVDAARRYARFGDKTFAFKVEQVANGWRVVQV